MLALAFWRYVDQRVKATTQAYWYAITLEACSRGLQQVPLTQSDAVSHAGGVVFKRAGGQVKYLLVQARKDRHEWVFPKGPIENGERAEETAVREVREETGVWARISKDLKRISLNVSGEPVEVQFYLMEALEEEKAADRERERAWLPLHEALCRAVHNETRDLLNLAAHLKEYKTGQSQGTAEKEELV
jgi:ADP-ribose pyrophosphatase YjhB (NUDIX family)